MLLFSLRKTPGPSGTGTKLVQISIAFIRDLADPLPISSPIRYQTGSLLTVIQFGTVSFQGGVSFQVKRARMDPIQIEPGIEPNPSDLM